MSACYLAACFFSSKASGKLHARVRIAWICAHSTQRRVDSTQWWMFYSMHFVFSTVLAHV